MAAIYATLGLAGKLAGTLADSGQLGAVAFGLGMLLVVAGIVAHGLNVRPHGIEIVVALSVTSTYLLLFVRMTYPADRTHLIEYGALGVLILEALVERVKCGRHAPMPHLLAILAATSLGVIDECIQAFLPNRVFDPRDILFNAFAAAMAVAASGALAWARQRA